MRWALGMDIRLNAINFQILARQKKKGGKNKKDLIAQKCKLESVQRLKLNFIWYCTVILCNPMVTDTHLQIIVLEYYQQYKVLTCNKIKAG